MDDLVRSISKITRATQKLARQAKKQYASEVENILRNRCRDPRRIEHLLNGLLGFGFDARMTRLYKKLCRHNFEIDPVATAS